MKSKILNLLLIVTSLIGYLEWRIDNKSFLFEVEYEVFRQMFTDPKQLVHPFVLLPLFGQLLLLATLFQKKPSKVLTYIGITCWGLLLGFMFFIGVVGMNYKILISTLPFIATAVFIIIHLRKQSKLEQETKILNKYE